MNDFSDDEFSFKGIAPGDRATDPEGPAAGAGSPAAPEAGDGAALPPLPEAPEGEDDLAGLFSFADGIPAEEAPAPVEAAPSEAPPAGVLPAPAADLPGLGPVPADAGPAVAPTPDASETPAVDAASTDAASTSSGADPAPAAADAPAAPDRTEDDGEPTAASPKLRVEIEESQEGSTSTVSPRHLVQGWLQQMVDAGASDLILRSGGRPSQRLDGRIHFLEGQVPGPGPMLDVLKGILGESRMASFTETGAADAALDLDGLGRFRINAYKQMGEPAIVIRRINEDAPSLDDLHLPAEELKDLALRKRGLVLVTGVAGSGKSTTLSAMIEFMNRNVERHIVTLEDPVELLFKERYCVISQREIGTDTGSFKLGLKHALRQSPDVILIGEMRDAETVLAALEAIETGHLVMSTMHTVNAAQTVDRILGFFPVERHAQIRQRMADTLAGVLSMRLVPRTGGGLIPAYELMSATPQVRELLETGKTTELGRVIQSGMERGLVSLNDRLAELVQSGAVSLEDAMAASDRPDELVMGLRGIHGGVRGAARAEAQRGEGGAPQAPPPAHPDPAPEGGLRLRKGHL